MQTTVLVTGGAGYIGAHVVVALARAGYAPLILDNFANSSKAVLPRLRRLVGADVPLIVADVRDRAALSRTFAEHRIDAVIHCAGLKAVAIGEAPSHAPNNLVPILAEVAAGQRSHVDVFGNDYPTPDGTGVRDYIHVSDLAEGHVAALSHLERQPGLATLNLGLGRGASVLE